VEKSRPPVYSKELKLLHCTAFARNTNTALTLKKIEWPYKLPERADPNSEDARLLGPFSKRREVNIRWRFFKTELKKVWPALQVVAEERSPDGSINRRTDQESLGKLGVRPMGLQDQGVLEEVLAIAGSGPPCTTLTRHQKQGTGSDGQPQTQPLYLYSIPPGSTLTPRFVRRRFQELLAKIPILSYSYSKPRPGLSAQGRYTVSQPPSAVSTDMRYAISRYAGADPEDLAWITSAEAKEPLKRDNDVKQCS
jgi:hypothetical protein